MVIVTPVCLAVPVAIDSIAVLVAIGNEPASHRTRNRIRRRRRMLAVAQEDALVPSARRCGHRPSGFQVHVSDHDHADRECGAVDFGVAATALNRAAMRALRDRQKLKEVRGYGDRRGYD